MFVIVFLTHICFARDISEEVEISLKNKTKHNNSPTQTLILIISSLIHLHWAETQCWMFIYWTCGQTQSRIMGIKGWLRK